MKHGKKKPVELRKERIGLALPLWMVQWSEVYCKQIGKSRAFIIEQALISHFKLTPPKKEQEK